MLDKVIEQLGELTQQKIADALATINEKSDSEREQITGWVLDTHGQLEQRLQDIEKGLKESIDCLDARRDALYVEETQQIVEKLNQLEVFAGQLANIKDGEKGERGEQGFQGEPGLDKPILEPVQLKDKDYPKSTLGVYNGGLWISTKDSVGDPDADPHAWTCILDAMTTMSVDLQQDRSFKLSVRMATGKLIEDTFKIPFPEHKGIWEEGHYQQGDIVTKGSSFWQAMEDTSGEPPGNGWKQILTAPRGKVGPAGKSIEGPQGKPGRNGLDAKLPPNFIDDLISIASERKAFEDGRSGAEAITSFRGSFAPEETYNRGDVVFFDGAIYLCTNGGRFRSIAASQSNWEIMLGVPKVAFVPYMHWQGQWVAKTYNPGMVVADKGWTMVANKATSDSAAPYGFGDNKYVADGAIYSDLTDTVKNVIYGTRIKQTLEPKFIRGYKIDVVDTFNYKVYTVVNPLSANPVITQRSSLTATATETIELSLPATPVPAGASFDVVVVITEPDPTPTEWTGVWDYDTPNNPGIPAAGTVSHANNLLGELRVSTTDNAAGDRYTELSLLSAGDTVSDGTSFWTITNIVDNTTWFAFTVSPSTQSNSDGVRTFTFGTTTPTAITIGQSADFYVGVDNVKGIFAVNGGWVDVVENDNAYAIDILYQDAYVSNDWDVVAYTDAEAAPQAVPQLTADEIAWVKEQFRRSLP